MKLAPRKVFVVLAWNAFCMALAYGVHARFSQIVYIGAMLACLLVPFAIAPNPANEDGAREDRNILAAIGVVIFVLLAPRCNSALQATALGLLPGVVCARLILILTRSR